MFKLSTVQVWVHDQDEALHWYTKVLGLELRSDITVAEMGNFRWLTVGPAEQPDLEIVLMEVPGEPVFSDEVQGQIKEVQAKGGYGGLFFTTDDIHARYAELVQAGVEFTQEPTQMPYGIDCGFRDPSGNHFRLSQLAELTIPA